MGRAILILYVEELGNGAFAACSHKQNQVSAMIPAI